MGVFTNIDINILYNTYVKLLFLFLFLFLNFLLIKKYMYPFLKKICINSFKKIQQQKFFWFTLQIIFMVFFLNFLYFLFIPFYIFFLSFFYDFYFNTLYNAFPFIFVRLSSMLNNVLYYSISFYYLIRLQSVTFYWVSYNFSLFVVVLFLFLIGYLLSFVLAYYIDNFLIVKYKYKVSLWRFIFLVFFSFFLFCLLVYYFNLNLIFIFCNFVFEIFFLN